VIVVEADLRRPALGRFLALRPTTGTPGIDWILRGQATIAEALVDVSFRSPGLPSANGSRSGTTRARERTRGRLRAILTRSDEAWAPGRVWPAEFGLIRTAEVVKELAEQADYVVIDSPPILVVTDAYPFAAAVDSVIAVVRNQSSTVTATEAMTKALERLEARRIQLLVTDVEPRFGMGYYYGRYGRPARRERTRTPSVSS
jgi:Mrp family chromosome partitioning ATPase